MKVALRLLQGRSKKLKFNIDSLKPSPLLTNFEKWAGKKKRLLIDNLISKNEETSKTLLRNLNLNSNTFAQFLSSPMRCDRLSRIKSPKELLIQAKFLPEDQTFKKFIIKLCSEQSKEGRNSYLVSSKELLQKNAKAMIRFAPLSITQSSIRKFKNSDIIVDPDVVLIYEKELVDEVKIKLAELLKTYIKIPEEINIRITFDSLNTIPINVISVPIEKHKNLQSNDETRIINLNINPETFPWLQELLKDYKEYPKIYLGHSFDTNTVLLIYKLLLFFS